MLTSNDIFLLIQLEIQTTTHHISHIKHRLHSHISNQTFKTIRSKFHYFFTITQNRMIKPCWNVWNALARRGRTFLQRKRVKSLIISQTAPQQRRVPSNPGWRWLMTWPFVICARPHLLPSADFLFIFFTLSFRATRLSSFSAFRQHFVD